MTDAISAGRQRQEKRKRYRRLMNYSLAIGMVGLVLATALWTVVPESIVVFAGVVVYWLGFLGYVGVRKATSTPLFDERETEIELKACGLTIGAFAYVVVFGVPAMVALSVTGTYTVPSPIRHALVAYLGLFAVFGVAYTYVQHTHS
ncbi:hypothetical protein [Natrarchaeobius oligotrophus]|uniref:DUF2178 domain-containing protein n=1 Tax=Natrarchaeobius chitinivorans TaxID=1679083 RepID=A0A3N6N2J2_NATCH|nr:hypothetical protein [Natrarchaeobius chitinivorans]RQH03072.1 hypothetical protein EA472_00270 [Natrarchaeobius chitinivorans]